MSVVDGTLKVHGIEHLRIADGSIMPRVKTGNTMARTVRRAWPIDQPVAISRHLIRTAPR
jgi:choline dehydrogenase-like flavoprotein